jgi:hypothetical protein
MRIVKFRAQVVPILARSRDRGRRSLRRLLVGVALAALQGCGGHGGGDSASQPPVLLGDADPTGLWQGTFKSDDGTARNFNVIAAPDGRFVGVIASSGTNGRFIVGTHDTTLNMFSAHGTVFAQAGEALLPNGQPSGALTVSNGNVVERASLSGSYSGGGESASFTLGYDGNTSRGASLQGIAGVYSVFPPPLINTATLAVSGGTLTFATDGGCNGAGTIDVIDPTMNIYSWSMLLSACGGVEGSMLSGLATLGDNPRNGHVLSLISLYGATASHDRSFVFRGFK